MAVAPSPATTGLSLTVQPGDGVNYPNSAFDVVLTPVGVQANYGNSEIWRATKNGDVITAAARGAYGTTAKSVAVGWQVSNSITAAFLEGMIGQVAGKNAIINGDFGVWQRGTSFTPAVNTQSTYTADRFYFVPDTTISGTLSQQTFAPGAAPVAGYEGTYYAQLTFAAGALGGYPVIGQRIEDVRKFAGQTVTVSFWAKASAAGTLYPVIRQVFGSGGSAGVLVTQATVAITTAWARYSFTVNIPSVAGKTIGPGSYLDIQPIWIEAASGFGSAATIDVWGVQVELGSAATQFTTASGTVGGELALCQRYYWRNTAASLYARFGNGFNSSTTQSNIVIQMPVTMRAAPTFGWGGGVFAMAGPGGVNFSVTAMVGDQMASLVCEITVTSSSLTSGGIGQLLAQGNTTAYVEFIAEL